MNVQDRSTTVISLRLRRDLARRFRVEAAQRGVRLNALFEEMLVAWQQAQRGDDHDQAEIKRG